MVERLEGRTLLSVAAIKDVNETDLSPFAMTGQGGAAYFVTQDQDGGSSLWTSDGASKGTTLLKSFAGVPGLNTSPRQLTVAGGALYFTQADQASETLLERLDLTTLDLTTVATSSEFPIGEAIRDLVATPSSLFFLSDAGRTLEALDLGSQTTSTLHTFDSAGDVAVGPEMIALGERVFFPATTGSGRELWTSDGTVAGTRLVTDLVAGDGSSYPQTLTVFHGTAYVVATDGSAYNLYSVDPGAASLTKVVADFDQNSAVVTSGNSLVFVAYSPATGYELFRSDGSPGSLSLVVDLTPGTADSNPQNLVDLNGTLFFTNTTLDLKTTRLYKTDGTPGGTTFLGNITLGAGVSADSLPTRSALVATANRIFFAGYDAASGIELWTSDGLPGGTHAVTDLVPGSSGSDPQSLTASGDRVYFAAHDGPHSNALFSSDGTGPGTNFVREFGTHFTRGSIDPSALTSAPSVAALGVFTYFAADDGDHGMEVWKTDGTASGTKLAFDVNAGPGGSNPTDFTAFGGALYFRAGASATGHVSLYKLNVSTGALTELVAPAFAEVIDRPIVSQAQLVFFRADFDPSGLSPGTVSTTLMRSDGTVAGTTSIRTFDAAQGASVTGEIAATSSLVFFVASDATHGAELWRSDLTLAGTRPTTDLNPGVDSSDPHELTAAGAMLYFVANDGNAGSELWKTNGEDGGTHLVANVSTLSNSFNLTELTVVGSNLYFVNDDGTQGPQVWKTDLASGATGLVALLGTSPASAGPSDLTAVGSRLVFRFDDISSPLRFFGTDGTAAGTVALNSDPIPLSGIVGLGGTAYFASTDGVNSAFYASDGTIDGTRVLTGIPAAFGLNEFAVIGQTSNGSLIAIGNDQVHGLEPVLIKDSSVRPVSYRPEMSYVVGDGPTGLATGDFNGDGKIDFATIEGGSGNVNVFLNRGDGSFSPPTVAFSSPGLTALVSADFNTDGKFDLAGIVDGKTIALFLSLGGGSFASPVTVLTSTGLSDLAVGELTGDGKADLVAASSTNSAILVAVNDGKGGFAVAQSFGAGGKATRLALADFNGDGKLDVAVSSPSGVNFAVRILNGDGLGGFGSPIVTQDLAISPEIAADDVTGDGIADLIILGANGLDLELGAGKGTFFPGSTFDTGSVTGRPMLADLNGDGFADLVVARPSPGGVSVLLSQGNGTFLPSLDLPTLLVPSGFAAADVDGDHQRDLIAMEPVGGPVPASGWAGVLLSRAPAPNAPPILRPITDQTFTLGQPASFTTSANDPNPGQTVSFSLRGGNTARAEIDAQTGVVTIHSLATESAVTLTLFVQATDNATVPLTTERAVSVKLVAPPPLNHKPTLDALADRSVIAGTTLSFQATASDIDVGQTLTFSVSAPGTTGVSIDGASGQFSYTPDASVSGTFTVTVSVTDNGEPALSDSKSFALTVNAPPPPVNHKPVLDALADQSVTAGTALSLKATASDPDSGQSLSYTVSAPGTTGLSIGAASGQLSYTPGVAVAGTFTVTVTV
ncbi:MAG: Hyalin repeat protein, partial [Planctomycetota bacterium]|nr:Hyalin repeat protein [Planctomycetota bacterium]